jgi:hypothetical protein
MMRIERWKRRFACRTCDACKKESAIRVVEGVLWAFALFTLDMWHKSLAYHFRDSTLDLLSKQHYTQFQTEHFLPPHPTLFHPVMCCRFTGSNQPIRLVQSHAHIIGRSETPNPPAILRLTSLSQSSTSHPSAGYLQFTSQHPCNIPNSYIAQFFGMQSRRKKSCRVPDIIVHAGVTDWDNAEVQLSTRRF